MENTESMAAELARLRAENDRLKRSSPKEKPISFKVSPKGGLSVYGMGRFPVTLYKEQWIKLLDASDEIKEFIADNDHLLKSK